MSLGETYNNNNKDKSKSSPVVYSSYKMSNTESKVDTTGLASSFWNNMLKISITPMKENEGKWTFDQDNEISVYLTHTKARILFLELQEFLANPQAYNNMGVTTGAGLISISNGKEFAVNCPCLVIRKLSSEGVVESSAAYQFKEDYHKSIRNFDEKTLDYDAIMYNNLEINQLMTLLETYYEAMTGAIAYSVIDQSKYNNSRINTKLDSVCDKLGIEYGGGKYSNKQQSTSIFNTKEPRNFNRSTIDDIESQIG